MASTNLELERPGGRFNADVGMLLTETDIDRIGAMSLQSILAFLSLLFFDDEQGVPLSGFPRDTLGRDHCIVSATSDLGFSVSTGWGFQFDSAAAVAPFGQNRFLPIVRAQAYTGTLGAHDATNPRIDKVCIRAATIGDESASRNVKNPSTGVVSSTSVDQRLRLTSEVLVVAGTPAASPTSPATPAGYVAIGEALVPAVSGAATWSDIRPVLELGHYFRGLPVHAVGNYVPLGTSNELLVTAASPAAMAVYVTRGRAVINGISRFYRAAVYPPLTVSAAHASLGRFDLVVARQNGTLDVVAGTAGSGVPPAVPSNAIALAMITVAPTVTTITSGDITDLRAREPFVGTTHLQARSTSHSRLNEQTVKVALSAGAPSGDTCLLTLTLTYPDGTPLPSTDLGAAGFGEAVQLVAEAFECENAATGVGTYGYAGAETIRQYTSPTQAADADRVAFSADGTNAAVIAGGGQKLHSPQMIFEVSDPADTATIYLRRSGSGVAGTFLVRVRPHNAPGSGTHVTVTFT